MKRVDTSKWVTQQELANELGVTVQCVHNWIARKKITSKKIGTSRLNMVDKTSLKK